MTGCAVVVFLNPAGPVHTVFTVTGTSTAGLNTTVQVRVTADPMTMVLLLMVTFGVGTREEQENNMQCLSQPLIIMQGDDQSSL